MIDRRTKIQLILALLAAAAPARADLARQHQSFDRLMLPGGRAAMLGGAYTALSNDPSGLFYNPAGTVQGKDDQISLNSWNGNRSEVVYKEAVKGQDFTETSNTLYGGFAGGIIHKDWLTLGYVIATLDKRNINQNDYFFEITDEVGQIRDFTRIHQESNSYEMFGASLAVELGKSWSLGIAAFAYNRTIEAMDYQQATFNGGQVLVQETKIRASNQGFHVLSGIQYHGESFSVGASMRAGEPIIDKGNLNFNSVRHAVENTVPEVENFSTDEYNSDAEVIPLIYRFGAAFHPTSGFLLSADVSYSAEHKVQTDSPHRLPTWNYALGMETGFKSWRFLFGVHTNNSTFPSLKDEVSNQPAHLDYLGKSIGTSIITKSTDFYIGYLRQDGRGKAQIVSGTTAHQKVEAKTENLLLSWTFKL